jgi:hypothetical protein
MKEVPKLTCKGCIARDRIIRSLAKKLDEIVQKLQEKMPMLRRVK